MTQRLENKVAFITGASRGIGKVCATELAYAGYDVAITARTVEVWPVVRSATRRLRK